MAVEAEAAEDGVVAVEATRTADRPTAEFYGGQQSYGGYGGQQNGGGQSYGTFSLASSLTVSPL